MRTAPAARPAPANLALRAKHIAVDDKGLSIAEQVGHAHLATSPWKRFIRLTVLQRRRERAAAIYTLIGAARLNDVNPEAWLADILARIADAIRSTAPRSYSLG